MSSPLGRVAMKHGAGGRAMRSLIQDLFVRAFAEREADSARAADEVTLSAMDDGAALKVGDRYLVMTTDSHVVSPLFFPGGDIGRLAISGTVNDLAMMGATEIVGLTAAFVI